MVLATSPVDVVVSETVSVTGENVFFSIVVVSIFEVVEASNK